MEISTAAEASACKGRFDNAIFLISCILGPNFPTLSSRFDDFLT